MSQLNIPRLRKHLVQKNCFYFEGYLVLAREMFCYSFNTSWTSRPEVIHHMCCFQSTLFFNHRYIPAVAQQKQNSFNDFLPMLKLDLFASSFPTGILSHPTVHQRKSSPFQVKQFRCSPLCIDISKYRNDIFTWNRNHKNI